MRLRVIWVGKTRNKHLKALIDDYLQRIEWFARCEVVEIRDSEARKVEEGIEDESKRIKRRLRTSGLTILLDNKGLELSSAEIAEEIRRWQLESVKEITFIIGGFGGVSDEVARQVNARWSLSRLTMTHEFVRVLLLEQIYRGYTIVHGLPYQK